MPTCELLATVPALLLRARSASGLRIIYKLGAGGMVPGAADPANKDHQCDCSGFTSWALGRSRQTTHPLYVRFNGGWINTDAMTHDAKSVTGFFSQILVARVGCLVVYPGGVGKVGHVGIVTRVADGKASRVIHCSSGNYRRTGDAIQETDLTVFQRPAAVFCWYEGIDP